MSSNAGSLREHEVEPVRGLPEALPADERLLWQGAPDWLMLARRAFHVPALALYFGVILMLHAATLLGSGQPLGAVAASTFKLASLAATGLALLLLLAWLSSRTTVYSITDRRIVMRIGIVLSVTYNLPLDKLEAAGMRGFGNGSGDIPLALGSGDRIAYLQLWPHARPWRVARPQPMLRCVPAAQSVAALLADAWAVANGQERHAASAAPAVAPSRSGHAGTPQATPA